MIEVRTVESAAHLSDRRKAAGLLEREVGRALSAEENNPAERSWGVVQAAEDNKNFGFA